MRAYGLRWNALGTVSGSLRAAGGGGRAVGDRCWCDGIGNGGRCHGNGIGVHNIGDRDQFGVIRDVLVAVGCVA